MLQRISIKGEVSNCKYHSSGHIYFTLKDASGTISAVMFAGNRGGLTFRMKEGDKVVVTGSVEVYEKSGQYQIYARTIEAEGEGDLYLKFEALKRELEEMGMFDPSYKQPIPKYVRRVGVVTAPTGAAVQDIRNIASRRNPYVQLILYPALVQGEGAAESVVRGIHAMEAQNVDVIIVGRGGGSIEDLWAFNEEIVARAIFDCSIPIISAVGHETDWTIADFVSDLRAPTPSAAAELAVYDVRDVLQSLSDIRRKLNYSMKSRIELYRNRLESDAKQWRLLNPVSVLHEKQRMVADYEENLHRSMENLFRTKKHRFELLAGRLDALSPLKKLSQGYALVEQGNQVLKTVDEVSPGDSLTLHLLDGDLKAEVTEVTKVGREER